MICIHKYPLEVTRYQSVEMPHGAKLVHIDLQGDRICVWAEGNSELPKVRRSFEIYGTGEPIETFARHLKTVLLGQFVWHTYGDM